MGSKFYIQKPVPLEAIQVLTAPTEHVIEVMKFAGMFGEYKFVTNEKKEITGISIRKDNPNSIIVSCTYTADVTEWIVKWEDGTFRILDDNTFKAMFQEFTEYAESKN